MTEGVTGGVTGGETGGETGGGEHSPSLSLELTSMLPEASMVKQIAPVQVAGGSKDFP